MTRNKASIPPINWDAENQAPTWGLLNQLEKTENFKVIFGKKNPREVSPFLTVSWSYSRTPGLRRCSKNTSGDSKIKVFKRIGQVLFPALHAIGCDLRGSLNTPGQGASFPPWPPWIAFADSEYCEWQESQLCQN